MDANDMGDDLQKILLTETQIQNRLAQMTAMIDQDYVGHEILLVGVLHDTVMVVADLTRKLHAPVVMGWMTVSSYDSGTKSSGVVRILKDLDTDIKDHHALIVKDIIGSGLTLLWLEFSLRGRSCASLDIMTLLRKPDAAKTTINPRYIGFDIPNEFVMGYGLDYAEGYRNLPFIGLLAPHIYE